MLNNIKNQRGFVLIEFVIALPLLILLIYSLTQMIIQTSRIIKNQVADYVLQNEAHEILEQITRDARAACSVEYAGNVKNETIIFVFHALTQNSTVPTADVRDTRRYIRHSKNYTEPIYHLYAQRQQTVTAPISGNNFLSDTSIEKLEFSTHASEGIGKILHISLEIKSMETERKFKVNTSVFMPACEEIKGVKYE